eukprot:gene8404-229_t
MQEYKLTNFGKKPVKRVERLLKRKDPKIIENTKNSMELYGKHTSETIKNVLSEFNLIRKPFSVKLQKKNDILPFEDATSIEFFAKKHDTSLFAFGSHSKKRPNNLIMGRLFNHLLLDMVEFGVENYQTMNYSSKTMSQLGSKPMIIFQGEFNNSDELKEIQNLLIDYFNGETPKKINLLGLDHVIVFSLINEKLINMERFQVEIKNQKKPQVSLTKIGPSMNLKIKRTKFATPELKKEAMRVPQELRKGKNRNKNISFDALGTKEGRLHVQQENLDNIALKRYDTKNLVEKLR